MKLKIAGVAVIGIALAVDFGLSSSWFQTAAWAVVIGIVAAIVALFATGRVDI